MFLLVFPGYVSVGYCAVLVSGRSVCAVRLWSALWCAFSLLNVQLLLCEDPASTPVVCQVRFLFHSSPVQGFCICWFRCSLCFPLKVYLLWFLFAPRSCCSLSRFKYFQGFMYFIFTLIVLLVACVSFLVMFRWLVPVVSPWLLCCSSLASLVCSSLASLVFVSGRRCWCAIRFRRCWYPSSWIVVVLFRRC